MTDPVEFAGWRHTPAGRRAGRVVVACAGACAVALVVGHVGTTLAGYTDRASTVFEVDGSYDIALVTTSEDGIETIQEGAPDAVVLRPSGDVLDRENPVSWEVGVISTAAPGNVALRMYDPQDKTFEVGGVQYADVYSQLLVTVASDGEELVRDVPATDLENDPLDLGRLDTDGRRDLTVSVVLAPDVRSVYDGRSTTVGLRFAGTTS